MWNDMIINDKPEAISNSPETSGSPDNSPENLNSVSEAKARPGRRNLGKELAHSHPES